MHVFVSRINSQMTLWINGQKIDSIPNDIDYGTIQDIHTNISNAPYDGWIDNFKAYAGTLTPTLPQYEYQCNNILRTPVE